MDQIAPSHQGFLRQHRERRQEADIGRHRDLRLDYNHEEAVESEIFSLRNFPRTRSEHV